MSNGQYVSGEMVAASMQIKNEMMIRKMTTKHLRCYPNNNVGIYPDGDGCRILDNAVSVSLANGKPLRGSGACVDSFVFTPR